MSSHGLYSKCDEFTQQLGELNVAYVLVEHDYVIENAFCEAAVLQDKTSTNHVKMETEIS